MLALSSHGLLLLAIADGVGGERGGEVASDEAIRTLEVAFEDAKSGQDLRQLLTVAFASANTAVYSRAQADRRFRRMATTLVAAIVQESNLCIANIGDSRAYIIDAARIAQVTRDHSLVAEGIRAGTLTPDDARSSGVRNVITRSVGSAPAVDAELFGPLHLLPGQTLLLCSDGLSDAVADGVIRDVVVRESDLDQAAKTLVTKANENGGPDNVSVVIYRAAATRPSDRPRK